MSGRTMPYRVVTGNTRYAFMLVSCVLIGVVLIVHIRTIKFVHVCTRLDRSYHATI